MKRDRKYRHRKSANAPKIMGKRRGDREQTIVDGYCFEFEIKCQSRLGELEVWLCKNEPTLIMNRMNGNTVFRINGQEGCHLTIRTALRLNLKS